VDAFSVPLPTLPAKGSWGVGAIAELQRLTVSLRGGFSRERHCLVFRFTGQLDAYSDKQFTDFITAQLELMPPLGVKTPVVVDLSRIDFIDSSGLGALVQLAKDCSERGVSFVLVGNARVVQTVKLVRLENFLHLQPDLESALDQFDAA
jgi:anti-sigma B factor antagonist